MRQKKKRSVLKGELLCVTFIDQAERVMLSSELLRDAAFGLHPIPQLAPRHSSGIPPIPSDVEDDSRGSQLSF